MTVTAARERALWHCAPVADLIEALWGDRPPINARHRVQLSDARESARRATWPGPGRVLAG